MTELDKQTIVLQFSLTVTNCWQFPDLLNGFEVRPPARISCKQVKRTQINYVVRHPYLVLSPFPSNLIFSANRPQSGQQIRPQSYQSQQPGNVPFIPSNSTQNFDATHFNLDSSAAAKQMAAMNAVGVQRQMANVNGRPSAASASQNPVGGTNPGSFLGGMSSSYNQPGGFVGPSHDTTGSMPFNSTTLGQPNAQGNYPPQPNTNPPSNPSLNTSMSHPNFPTQEFIKQRHRTFLMGLANAHMNHGAPLPPALTSVPYPPNYDPTNSPWKSLECPSGQFGVVRLGGKEIDLLKLWTLVNQVGGWQKVRWFILYYCHMLKHDILGLTTE